MGKKGEVKYFSFASKIGQADPVTTKSYHLMVLSFINSSSPTSL